MGRIFISAGHGGIEKGSRDPGSIAGSTTEAQEMILLRDQVVPELKKQRFEVLSVPDNLSMSQTIQWINALARPGDVALEIHADTSSNPNVRGAVAFYIANNTERKNHADLLLLALQSRVPQLPNREARPDTVTGAGGLSFCRNTVPPSLLIGVGFLSNSADRALIQNKRREMALGLADGLAAWSRLVADTGLKPTRGYLPIGVNLNDRTYSGKGILINGNAYIATDLVEELGVNLSDALRLNCVPYQGVVYARAIELREYNVSVSWDNANRRAILRSLPIDSNQINQIIGKGRTSEQHLRDFLQTSNKDALNQFRDLPALYRQEALNEGVNHDIAFCQMCLETDFLRFSGDIKPSYNNFGGLAGVGGSESALFKSAQIGVRAHIQHLKAYASERRDIPKDEVVAPRYFYISPGLAVEIENKVENLGGHWSADPQYGNKILELVRQLYKIARLL
jgi:hypothetical protein